MKKFSLLVMFSLLVTAFAALSAVAQEAQEDPDVTCYKEWFDASQTRKDIPGAAKVARKCLAQKSDSQYKKYYQQSIDRYLTSLKAAFYDSLKAFYNGPDTAKLSKLLADGDIVLAEIPNEPGVTAYSALATDIGAMSNFHDMNQAKAWTEKAMPIIEPEAAPEGWPADQWATLRTTGQAKFNQFLGYYHLKQTPPDYEKAEEYLTKSAGITSKQPSEGASDPYTYWFRTDVYNKQYQDLSAQYNALPSDDEKNGPAGKEILGKIKPVVKKMIADYGRVVVLATHPAMKPMQDASREQAAAFWKFVYNNTDGLEAFITSMKGNPSADPAFPAEPETTNVPSASVPTGKKDVSIAPVAAGGDTSTNKGGKGGKKPATRRRRP